MKTGKQKNALSAVLRRLTAHPFYLAVSLVCAVLYVAATLYSPAVTGYAIDCIVGEGNVDIARVLGYLLTFGVLVVLASLLQWIMSVCTNKMSYMTVRDIRAEAMDKLQRLPVSYMDSHSRGDIISRIMSDTAEIENGLVMSISTFVTGVLTVISIIAVLIRASITIAAVVILVTPLSLFCAYYISKKSFTHFSEQSRTRGLVTGLIDETAGAERTVISYGAGDEMIKRFDELNEAAKTASLKAVFVSSVTNPATRFINNLVFAGVALTGALSVIGGGITVGELSCFLSYANQYTKPFNEITGVLAELQNSAACAGRIFEFLDESEETPDVGEARDGAPTGRVEFDDVSFSYTPERPLIEHLSLDIAPGQKIALVGPTGCGKTTFINLLMRFYDVTGGTIRVDGTDIREMPREALRSMFGMVLQDTWVRHGTVRENITLGMEGVSDEDMIAAAKMSHAHSFIKRLPQGYDTVIDEGDGLSEGQRQLLCIARVMLRRPPMLILDEATSSIDTRTELLVQDAFLRLMEGRTSFIVAHRLSTIREADMILVMKDGHIIESGTHDELLNADGFYRTLYESQFAGRDGAAS